MLTGFVSLWEHKEQYAIFGRLVRTCCGHAGLASPPLWHSALIGSTAPGIMLALLRDTEDMDVNEE